MFSKKLTYLMLLILALAIFGCSENPTVVNDNQWQTPTSIENPCGAQYYDLYVERKTLAGTVTFANDQDTLYITYFLNSPYLAEPGEMRVWLGSTAPTKRGVLRRYPYHSRNRDYVSTYTFTIAISDIQQYLVGKTFYFMTYFSAVTPQRRGHYSPSRDGFSVEINWNRSGVNWYGYNSYTLQDCSPNLN